MMHETNSLKKYIPLLFILNGLCQFSLFWPGVLISDAAVQYKQALVGLYTDHHPALMSFIWHYLIKIQEGPSPMLGINILLLNASAFTLYQAFSKDSKAWTFVLLPWIPGVMVYMMFIFKDIHFAYGFLFCVSLLTKAHMQERKLNLIETIVFFLILFYATAVKFQGQYLAPFVILWFITQQLKDRNNLFFKKAVFFLATLGIFYSSLSAVNDYLVPSKQKDHSWQLVKLFDLAVIGFKNNTSFIPKANQGTDYTYEHMRDTFYADTFYAIDELYFTNPIVQLGKNDVERQALWNTWAKVVLKHPLDYLTHRFRNLATTVGGTPGFTWIDKKLDSFLGNGSTAHKVVRPMIRAIGFVFMAGLLTIFLGLFYLVLGLRSLKFSKAALPLVYITTIGLGMPSLLLFFSMAGTARYIIITMVMIHSCHLMAWRCLQSIRAERNTP